MLLNEDVWIYEMMTKLSGVILKKAFIENDFKKVYGRVFETLINIEFNDEKNILEIFGNVGG